jgi:outer membrane protein, heavy metal efflux system
MCNKTILLSKDCLKKVLILLMFQSFTSAVLVKQQSLFATEPVAEQQGRQASPENPSLEITPGWGEKSPELNDSSALEDYLRYAAANNPGLEAAFNRWQASLEKVPQARALPDPRLTYSYFIRELETRVGPQRQRLGLSQTFPWFGKLGLRAKAAGEDAARQEQKYQAARLALLYRVKTVFYDYYFLSRSLAVTEENLRLLTSLEAVARAKYSTGTTGYSSLLKAQLELGRIEDRLQSLEDIRNVQAARLNSALNRPVASPLPWPGEIGTVEKELNEEKLMELLAERNPELNALDLLAEKGNIEAQLAGKNIFPDITLGLDYMQTGRALMPGTVDDGKDPLMAMFSVNLPLNRGKYRAAEREARLRSSAARLQRQDRENSLKVELKAALFNYRDSERKISLYRDALIPKAEQALGAAGKSFTSGFNADFLDLVEAQRTLLEFQLAYEEAVVKRAETRAKIEMLVGTDDL